MKQKSFTLIEMLIVIVIIGILAAALVPRLQSVQARARDTQRKVDGRTISSANEIYKSDNGNYVRPRNAAETSCNIDQTCSVHSVQVTASTWLSGLETILTSVPRDPRNIIGASWANGHLLYEYGFVFSSPSTFTINMKLENTSDPDRCALKAYTFYYSAAVPAYACGSLSPYMYIVGPSTPQH